MSNHSNNPYPDISTQPLLLAPQPPRPNQPVYAPYNQQGYAATNQTFPAYQPPLPNQGYIPSNQTAPSNQGFQQNNGGQGFQPNQPIPPIPPIQGQGFPPNQGQGYGPNGQLHCPFCGRWTDSVSKKAAGGVTYIWCFALFLLTGVFCCIPFCVDGCQDTMMVCAVCQGVKARIEANCC
jgi:hypothetical protein